ncbi:DNA-binding transcriptional regulator, PadR family [Evansella caseinilytica]|uniref:DNA-binding transcriptional regulator, PadR family n=1 Tax=Evansella caseinilytica TaxID=1503961 RepID=A0A1H3RL48_9BACI|nr:PadR family transcriptional regulator [Evansella caseinilytica]SDZ26427.1 DNA-binding transcriptional regulator, PadR family [Evansella caseinilytica]
MKKYNHTTYAILGILTTECTSGYAIKQFIDQSLNHFWKISYGQIYPTLKAIVADGLAEVHTSSHEGRPDRHEYSLTSKGIDVLTSWLEQPVEQVPVERNEVLLKLFFGRYQSKASKVRILHDYKQKLADRYQTYVSIEQAILAHKNNNEAAAYWLCTLDYGKRITLAAIDWCTAALDQFSVEEE